MERTQNSRVLAIVLALTTIVVILFASVVPARAATSATKTRNNKAVTQLVNTAEYYGYTVAEKKITSSTKKNVTTRVKLENDKCFFQFNVKTTRKGKSLRTAYQSLTGGKKTLTFSGVKTSLKNYKTSSSINQIIEDKSAIAAEDLAAFGETNGWTTTQTQSGAKSKIEYSNSKYKFVATVTVKRKGGKYNYSYTRDGKSSKKKDVKSWLTTYKV